VSTVALTIVLHMLGLFSGASLFGGRRVLLSLVALIVLSTCDTRSYFVR